MHVILHGFSLQILDYTSFEVNVKRSSTSRLWSFYIRPQIAYFLTAFAYSCYGTHIVKKKKLRNRNTISVYLACVGAALVFRGHTLRLV